MKTIYINLTIFCVVILFGFESANACMCMGTEKPTAEFRKTPVVFVGTVKAVNEAGSRKPGGEFNNLRTTLTVDEAFKGVSGKEIDIYSSNLSACGFTFQEGARYLVYAYGEGEKYYSTSGCTRTRLANSKEDEIAVLRSLAKGAFEPRLYGRVEEIVRGIKLEYSENVPMSGIQVIANNGSVTYRTTTDKDGLFRFVNVKTGNYRIQVNLPSTHEVGNDSWDFPRKNGTDSSYQVTTSDSPDFISVETRIDGRIKGRVFDSQGKPASKSVYITLITKETVNYPDDKTKYIGTETDKDGFFEFYGIPEGEYYLGINLDLRQAWKNNPYPKTFYPNTTNPESATLIKLGYGQKMGGFNLILPPPLKSVVTKGKVLNADGTPASGAEVYVSNRARHDFEDFVWLKADRNGEFSVICLGGLTYRFAVFTNASGQANAEIIQKIDAQAINPIELVLKK